MSYIDIRDMSDEEKSRRRRRLMLDQISFQSDLKKIDRELLVLKEELRRFENDRARLDMDIAQNKEKTRALNERTDFMKEELRRVKKMMIELG